MSFLSILFADDGSQVEVEGMEPQSVRGRGRMGSALGFFATPRALNIPGLGPIIAAGAIVAKLRGVAGELSGGLAGMGIPVGDARRYEAKIRSGAILVAVHVEHLAVRDLAKRVFRAYLAEDIICTDDPRLAIAESGTHRVRTPYMTPASAGPVSSSRMRLPQSA